MGTPVRQEPYFVQKNPKVFPKRKRLPDGTFEPLTCTCTSCGRIYEYDYPAGHTKLTCNSCRAKQWSPPAEAKQRLVDVEGGSCQTCGYDACIGALTFHHLDASTKRFNIAGSQNRSWESQLREVAKCILVCENCHREIHAGLREIPEDIRLEIEAAIASEVRQHRRRGGRPRYQPRAH